MFEPRIRIRKGLYDEVKRTAAARGYASAEEFVAHALEKAVREDREAVAEEEVRKRLKGLGYLE